MVPVLDIWMSSLLYRCDYSVHLGCCRFPRPVQRGWWWLSENVTHGKLASPPRRGSPATSNRLNWCCGRRRWGGRQPERECLSALVPCLTHRTKSRHTSKPATAHLVCWDCENRTHFPVLYFPVWSFVFNWSLSWEMDICIRGSLRGRQNSFTPARDR